MSVRATRFAGSRNAPDIKYRLKRKAGRVRYWQYGEAEKSPDLAISDLSRFLASLPASKAGELGKQAAWLPFLAVDLAPTPDQ